MSFWEDASPATKGVIVVGVVAILYFGVAFAAGIFPFNSAQSDEAGEVTQTRGVQR